MGSGGVAIAAQPTVICLKVPFSDSLGGGALGVTKVKSELNKATGIPTTKAGVERKIGGAIIKAIFGKK